MNTIFKKESSIRYLQQYNYFFNSSFLLLKIYLYLTHTIRWNTIVQMFSMVYMNCDI